VPEHVRDPGGQDNPIRFQGHIYSVCSILAYPPPRRTRTETDENNGDRGCEHHASGWRGGCHSAWTHVKLHVGNSECVFANLDNLYIMSGTLQFGVPWTLQSESSKSTEILENVAL